MRPIHTIKPEDVGMRTLRVKACDCCDRWVVIPCSSFMGPVQPRDVGKRIYLNDGIYQVENDEQRDRRNSP